MTPSHTPPILVSAIVNWDTPAPQLAEAFEFHLDAWKALFNHRASGVALGGDLDVIYLQLQYDVLRLPGAVKTLRVGRFSASKRHIQAYVAVSRAALESAPLAERATVIMQSLQSLAEAVAQRLEKRNVPGLPAVMDVLRSTCRQYASEQLTPRRLRPEA